jgi:hypothetical protein
MGIFEHIRGYLDEKRHHPDEHPCILIENLTINVGEEKPHPLRPKLAFNIYVNNKNFNSMAIVTSLNLTSTAPVTLTMTVVDQTGTVIAGALTGLSYAPADATQDLAVVDPSNALEVDIHAVSPTGGTSLVATGTFVSTLLGSDGVTPAFSGPVTGTLTITNNVAVVTLTPSLAFNQ